MAKRKKLPFPKYLNRPKLWLRWEQDELMFGAIVVGVATAVLFVIAVPLYVLVVMDVLLVYVAGKIYKKLVKEAPPGFLSHFFYGTGIADPNKGENTRVRIPYGFEKRFID